MGDCKHRKSHFRALMLADIRGVSAAEYALILAIVGTAVALVAFSTIEQPGSSIKPASMPVDVQAGQGAFIMPPPMVIGHWYPVEFIAAPNVSKLANEAEDERTTKPRAIYVGSTMRVSLLPDPSFDIKSKSDEQKETGVDRTASWQWDVRPRVTGNQKLIAQIIILARQPGGHYDIYNRYTRRVAVSVGVGRLQGTLDEIGNAKSVGEALTSLLKSWTAVLLGLAALIGAWAAVKLAIRNSKRRRRKLEREQPGIEEET